MIVKDTPISYFCVTSKNLHYSLHYISPNNSKNTSLKHILLTGIGDCNFQLSKNIQFEKRYSNIFQYFRKSARKSKSKVGILEVLRVFCTNDHSENGSSPISCYSLFLHPLKIQKNIDFWGVQKGTFGMRWVNAEAVVRRCSSKQVFLKISQYSQANTSVGVS